ncbi:hypothetical protein C8J57DRAFT_1356403 [Mycena rebaudengoi]|nr:hypothetical protein C8J57DRAFT_1356403 [Mycena rebaudengoi]
MDLKVRKLASFIGVGMERTVRSKLGRFDWACPAGAGGEVQCTSPKKVQWQPLILDVGRAAGDSMRVHNARIVGSGDYTCDALRARCERTVAARSSQDTVVLRDLARLLCAGDEQGTYTEGQDTYHSCVETQDICRTNILFLTPFCRTDVGDTGLSASSRGPRPEAPSSWYKGRC